MIKFNEHGVTLKAHAAEECGRYDEVVPICAECLSEKIGEVSSGDEGWTVCSDCGSVEQGYKYIHESEVDEVGNE